MNDINQQTFLNELSALLTFMTEDDRLEALTLYEKMFDDTDDEQTLIRALQSPTRQAVVIARAYDASARKKQASLAERSRDAEEEPTPAFVRAILHSYEKVPLSADPDPRPVVMPADPLPAPQPAADEPVRPLAETSVTPEEEAPVPEEKPEEAPLVVAPAFDPEKTADTEETPEEEPLIPRSGLREEEAEEERALPGETRVRTRPFLMTVFVLLAIPVTLLGVLLLLLPTVLSLLLASGAIAAGGAGIVTAFGGFALFSEKLIVLGCAVILLALGVLFLWLFTWFVFGGIVGLFRGVIRLGRAWCCEEVPA